MLLDHWLFGIGILRWEARKVAFVTNSSSPQSFKVAVLQSDSRAMYIGCKLKKMQRALVSCTGSTLTKV